MMNKVMLYVWANLFQLDPFKDLYLLTQLNCIHLMKGAIFIVYNCN